MRYLSLFSGIEAASVAWKPLGWECVGVAEIEKFPCAVLKHHYPDVPNLGDVTKITAKQIKALGKIDLVVGGFPCQDVSQAGKRKGLRNADGTVTRSGLFFDAMRLVRAADPRWLVIENVPGLFSSNRGRDFAAVVGEILGITVDVPRDGWRNTGVAASKRGLVEWSVLDAQFFGLAQRRQRVFLVADFGDWDGRPPVLLERESLLGNLEARPKARQDVTGTLGARTTAGGGLGTDFDLGGGSSQPDGVAAANPLEGVAHALTAHPGGRYDFETETFVAHPDPFGAKTHSLDTDGHSVAVALMEPSHADATKADTSKVLRRVRDEIGEEAFTQWGLGVASALQSAEILRPEMYGARVRQATSPGRRMGRGARRSEKPDTEGAMQSLWTRECSRCPPQGSQLPKQLDREFGAYLSKLSQFGAHQEGFLRDLWAASEGLGVLQQALHQIQEARRSGSVEDPSTQEVLDLRSAGEQQGTLRETLHASQERQADHRGAADEKGGCGVMTVRRLTPRLSRVREIAGICRRLPQHHLSQETGSRRPQVPGARQQQGDSCREVDRRQDKSGSSRLDRCQNRSMTA